MRSLFKFSLAALLALVLGAGSAMALDVKWSGNIGAGFGLVTYGETGTAEGASDNARGEYVTSYEANIRATIGGGPLTMINRLRPRGNQQSSGTQGAVSAQGGNQGNSGGNLAGLSDIYNEVWWKPTDAFSIGFGRFQGQAWSQPMSGTYLINHPLGAPEYFMNWTGIDGIDLEFNAGVVQVGLAIASECRPSCGSAAVTHVGGTTAPFVVGVTAGENSIVPHLTGKFGDIGLRASLPQTSKQVGNGAAAGTSEEIETLTGAGMQVGVSWSGMQGVYVGFDYQSFIDKGNDKVAGPGPEDQTRTGMGLRVDFEGFQLGYHSLKTTNNAGVDGAEKTGTWIKVAYFIKVGDGSIVPEYTTYTVNTKDADPADVTNTLLRIVGNMPF
jgi:hypothetical protein